MFFRWMLLASMAFFFTLLKNVTTYTSTFLSVSCNMSRCPATTATAATAATAAATTTAATTATEARRMCIYAENVYIQTQVCVARGFIRLLKAGEYCAPDGSSNRMGIMAIHVVVVMINEPHHKELVVCLSCREKDDKHRERERDTYTNVNLSCRSKPQQMMLNMLLLMPVVNEGEFVCQALHFFYVIVISHTVGNLSHIGNLTLKPGSSQLLSKAVAQSCQGDFSFQHVFLTCQVPEAQQFRCWGAAL